ncbi:hypothetical protein [Mesorhizobium sp. A623]
MAGKSKRTLYPSRINKDNLFNLPKHPPAGKNGTNNRLRSMIDAEKAERDAKTARLRTLRLANAEK